MWLTHWPYQPRRDQGSEVETRQRRFFWGRGKPMKYLSSWHEAETSKMSASRQPQGKTSASRTVSLYWWAMQITPCQYCLGMWIGSRDPKKLPDPGFQTTRKLPPRPLPHSETTGLPAQQGQSRHCSVLSETVATVSLRRSHLVHPRQSRTCWADISHITSQTMCWAESITQVGD